MAQPNQGDQPSNPGVNEYQQVAWEKAMTVCRTQLNKDDFQQIHNLQSSDALIENVHQTHLYQSGHNVSSVLKRLSPSLYHVSDFLAVYAIASRGNILQTTLVWGAINLAIQIAAAYGAILSEVIEMLEDMGHDLEIFKMYQWIFETESSTEERLDDLLVDVLVDAITFWVKTIRFLRRNPLVNMAKLAWPTVRSEFESTTTRIRKKIRQIKERAEALSLKEASSQNKKRHTDGESTVDHAAVELDLETHFPCSNIPFPRNPHFSGRSSEIDRIRVALDHDYEHPSYKALTIVGMGGVGKSQTALSYAYERLEKNVAAVFWIDGENAVTLSQSYSEIVRILHLKGAVASGGFDVNRYLLNQWLQTTSVSWLLIFDNVEDSEQLRDCLPMTARGSVLITTRNDLVALDAATRTLKIPVFTSKQGAAIIINNLERDACPTEERCAAESLSDELGGLALALNIMATHIRLRQMSITQFLALYRRNADRSIKSPHGNRNRYYKHSLSTAWKMSFDALDEDSIAVFGVICFIGPDDIPEELFRPEETDGAALLPPFDDPWGLDDAITKLLSSSLLSRDPISSKYHVHRLVQKEFRDWLGPERRLTSFHWAARLLYEAFPKQISMSTLHPYWPTCELYIQHAIMLGNYFTKYSFQNDPKARLQDFAVLLANATWYLFEISEYDLSIELLQPAYSACRGEQSLLYARLCQTAGVARREQGNLTQAYQFLERTKAIYERLLPSNHQDIANVLNNIAGVMLSDWRIDDSLATYQAALDIDLQKPREEIRYIVYLRYLNMGLCYTAKGMFQKAEEALDIGTEYILEALGEGSHFNGMSQFYRASLYLAQDDLVQARHWAEKAHRNFAEEREYHLVTIGGRYKIAIIDMKEGLLEDAITRLRSTLKLCEVCEPRIDWQGHTARTLRKLAEALFVKDENDQEAKQCKERAENIRKRMQGDKFDKMPDNDHSYDSLIAHYWR